jgi:DedD protein
LYIALVRDRLREKIEVLLDDRQIAALAVGALILLGGVFTLGLLVGKHVAARAAAARSPADELALLDAQREGQARRPAAPAVARAEEPARPVALPPVKADEPTRAVPPPPAPANVAPAAKEAARVVPPPPPPVAVAAPHSALLRVAASLPRPPAELGKFTVQLGASQEKADAARLASRASGVGLRPYVAEARIPGKGLWYRVRVGAFADRDAAERYRRDVERELKTAAAVMPSR